MIENHDFRKGGNINILVTGASGFVGANLTRALVRQGHMVYAIVRDESKFRAILGDSCADRVKILRGDLLDSSDLRNLENQLAHLEDNLDVVVQTVGGGPLTSNRALSPAISELNYRTTANLVRILEDSQKLPSVRLLVYFSSLAAMGMPESNGTHIHYDESSACNPVLPYERTKFETEAFLKGFANEHKLKTVALRFPQIYGGTDDALMQMLKLIRKGAFPIVRGKIGTLPLIHIRDVVGSTCSVIRNVGEIQEQFSVYVISEGSYSYNEFVDLVKRKYGRGGALRLPYSLMYFAVSILELAFRLIGKPEPLNRRRLLSLTKDRVVDSGRFKNTFQFRCEENVESFVTNQLT